MHKHSYRTRITSLNITLAFHLSNLINSQIEQGLYVPIILPEKEKIGNTPTLTLLCFRLYTKPSLRSLTMFLALALALALNKIC